MCGAQFSLASWQTYVTRKNGTFRDPRPEHAAALKLLEPLMPNVVRIFTKHAGSKEGASRRSL